jgi:hypothetical protein
MTVLLVLLAVLVVVVLAVFISLGIRWSRISRLRTAENLQKLAGQLGLEFQPRVGPAKRPGLAGRLGGKPAEIFSYSVSNGKTSTPWIAISIQLTAASGLTFNLQKQGFRSKVLELFGAHEVTVGDPEFDAAWFVHTNRPDFFRAALIPELRAKLMTAQHSGARGAFELKGGVVKYAEVGTFAEAPRTQRFVALANLLRDLVDVAEVAGP